MVSLPIILAGSQLFFIETTTSLILVSMTLLSVVTLGWYFIFSIKNIVEQQNKFQKLKSEIEKNNKILKTANKNLKKLDSQKMEFISLVSHQLRSPLTIMKGYSSMILEGSFGEVNNEVKNAVSKIFESSQKLVSVIVDFLNITLIEFGRMEYNLSEFSLNILVKDVIAKEKQNFERRGLIIDYEEEAEEYKIYADMTKLSQVIFNLIDNAGKYSKQGIIKIKIARGNNQSEKKVCLSVSDMGVGISPLLLPNLFNKFTRANDVSNNTNLVIGTGFGLYVSKKVIDAHSGARIWAESKGQDRGATFFIEFPLSTGVAPTILVPASNG